MRYPTEFLIALEKSDCHNIVSALLAASEDNMKLASKFFAIADSLERFGDCPGCHGNGELHGNYALTWKCTEKGCGASKALNSATEICSR